jgi:NADH:ubiquinone oxidoreductase subunit 3 (subunit A)
MMAENRDDYAAILIFLVVIAVFLVAMTTVIPSVTPRAG